MKDERIAIITDAHALYEPTHAALSKIKEMGIKNIYSLGDNIGVGPNPHEVLELLKEYNVISIKGNHELYANSDMNLYKDHFPTLMDFVQCYESTLETNKKLSSDELSEIYNYPEYIELCINGKKILLCHYINDYVTRDIKYDLSKYDYVFEGHVHFASQKDNVTCIRGLAVGLEDTDEYCATFCVIEPSKDDIKISYYKVPYDEEKMYESLLENSTSLYDKSRLANWTRTGRL